MVCFLFKWLIDDARDDRRRALAIVSLELIDD